ncbi:helix-turn-helix transcriptional regulator [Streptomyces sp. NA02950]|uniref:helix-turn-helix domain-containing protein n=1 Tax=Streptomyces sp. NA02950 TaxID=2742137 RepID=UPI001591BF4E|nr:helix-turn-helix transcriptional regulator [Streptomyces sp. NA02950]QKV96739.1 helix-turn-helix transcriptional regulator [Streptomyces sp. NA02950]
MAVNPSGDFADLARRALRNAGYSMKAAARETHYDPAFLSRVLNRKQKPSPALARALDELTGTGGTLAGNLQQDERLSHVAAHPSRIDGAAVSALAGALAAQRHADDIVGPGPLIGAAEAQREALLPMLRDARGSHRDALCAVVSESAQFAGWLNIELGQYARADVLLNEAIALADDIADGSLVAQAYNLKGNIARQRGQHHAVHRNFVAAYVSESAKRQRVVNGAQAASALALLGRRSEAERMLSEIEALREKAVDETPPGTAYWLSPEWLSLPIGHVHHHLGRPQQAAECIRHGLDSLPPEHRNALWTREARAALEEAESA